MRNGVTKAEIGELITHLAFYAGWPAAMTAALVAKDVFEKNPEQRVVGLPLRPTTRFIVSRA